MPPALGLRLLIMAPVGEPHLGLRPIAQWRKSLGWTPQALGAPHLLSRGSRTPLTLGWGTASQKVNKLLNGFLGPQENLRPILPVPVIERTHVPGFGSPWSIGSLGVLENLPRIEIELGGPSFGDETFPSPIRICHQPSISFRTLRAAVRPRAA